MTSQIVEEQTDFVEEQIESEILKMKILCKFKGLNTNQILSVEAQMRSFASTLVERERERIEDIITDYFKGLILISDPQLTKDNLIKYIRTKLQEMR